MRCSAGKGTCCQADDPSLVSGTHLEGGGKTPQVSPDFCMHCLTCEHLWLQINAKEKKLKEGTQVLSTLPRAVGPVVSQSLRIRQLEPVSKRLSTSWMTLTPFPSHLQLSSFDVRSRLCRFIAEAPHDLALPPEEAEILSTEAFRLWAVAASYGQGGDLYR